MEYKFCEHCGAAMPPGANFCPACGRKPSMVDSSQLTVDSSDYNSQLSTVESQLNSNLFTQSSGQTHEGEQTKKPPKRGIIIGGIAAGVVLAAAVAAAVIFGGMDADEPEAAQALGIAPPQTEPAIVSRVESLSAQESSELPESQALSQPPESEGPSGSEETLEAESESDAETSAVSDTESMGQEILADFDWYLNGVLSVSEEDGAAYLRLPEGMSVISDRALLTGSWKGLIFYDPSREHGVEVMEIANVDIEGTDEVTLTVNWYRAIWGYEVTSSDDVDPNVFTGEWSERGLNVTGAGDMSIDIFYELDDGLQYAVGMYASPGGIPALVALVRET